MADLVGYEQWREGRNDHMIQMHNAIMQILDLHIAVAYPMDYIPKDTPQHLLDTCRHLLLHEHVSEAPCTHPKELAINVLNQACL